MKKLTKKNLQKLSYKQLRAALKFNRDYFGLELNCSLKANRATLEQEFIRWNKTDYSFQNIFTKAYNGLIEAGTRSDRTISLKDINSKLWDLSVNSMVEQCQIIRHFTPEADTVLKRYMKKAVIEFK